MWFYYYWCIRTVSEGFGTASLGSFVWHLMEGKVELQHDTDQGLQQCLHGLHSHCYRLSPIHSLQSKMMWITNLHLPLGFVISRQLGCKGRQTTRMTTIAGAISTFCSLLLFLLNHDCHQPFFTFSTTNYSRKYLRNKTAVCMTWYADTYGKEYTNSNLYQTAAKR